MKIALSVAVFAALSASSLFSADIPSLESKAKGGDADAQFELARVYLKGGDGVQRDVMRSFELMTSAANHGHAEAMGGVGFFYASGTAVPKNEAKAVEWFQKGAEAGGAKAQLNLGKMLIEGKGVEKNETEGKKWIRKAADQRQPDAAFSLATIFYFGKYGEKEDRSMAYPYLLIAAESDNPDAQNLLGLLLQTDVLGQSNAMEAEKWFRKSALKGNANAQTNLGAILGPHGGQDRKRRVEAIMWLLLADKQGDICAGKILVELLPNADKLEIEEAKRLAGDYPNIKVAPSSR